MIMRVTEKAVKKAANIERLTFTQDDFYDNDGNPKYEADAEKLPWKDPMKMYEYLKWVKFLNYTMSTLVEETNALDTKELSSKMTVDIDYEEVKFDNVFVGFDRNSLPEDTEMPTITIESDNPTYASVPFPYEGYTFRVTSKNEDITVKAGTYTCTTVELIGNNEEKIKLWMVNDKPGVVAKVIIEGEDPFGALEYRMFELSKIDRYNVN